MFCHPRNGKCSGIGFGDGMGQKILLERRCNTSLSDHAIESPVGRKLRCRCLVLPDEAVANPADGEDTVAVILQLGPQPFDVGVHRPGISGKIVAPDAFQ